LELLHVEADRAYVRGTLDPDALVVISGAHRLTPGQVVSTAATESPTDEPPAAAPPVRPAERD
ncbi:MAG: hypothetical protein P8M11_02425, partial [Planctomycetota bacterium]|nr:hypothetical protein [Planctomycetota bacterium]